ncbi:hypothetical protein M9H77_23202 [Catharanthus roseus]|uniref:Uncharacterized protein n=1 Tax=Catharanthus roseus TaxID=4058 RepID=A0ACC0ASN0_CATRO|nr:hypothetical protein M9H77_23202 [Catharanthus roseus]
MEAMRRQEDYQSELARDMHNCYYGGGNGVNAYGGRNHGHGNFISRGHDDYRNFTPKRHNGVGNFSSYAKSHGHTSYDDYGGTSNQGGDLGRDFDPILQAQEDSYQIGIRASSI